MAIYMCDDRKMLFHIIVYFLWHKSHFLRDYFSEFARHFVLFCMVLMQAGNLHQVTQTNLEKSECDTEKGNSV